jgi:hypothetical protein
MSISNSEQAFYARGGNDSLGITPADAAPNVTGNRLDGRVAATTDTSGQHLNNTQIIDNTNSGGAACDKNGDCHYVDAKFRADKNAKYEVEIINGEIHVTKEDGSRTVATPQEHHPAARDEAARRSSNFYNGNNSDSGFYASNDSGFDSSIAPVPQNLYPPPQPEWGMSQPQPYGYWNSQPPPNVGASFLLGLIGHGHRFGPHYGGYGGDSWRYNTGVVGYNPAGYMPIGPSFVQPNNYAWYQQHRWGGWHRPGIALNLNLGSSGYDNSYNTYNTYNTAYNGYDNGDGFYN